MVTISHQQSAVCAVGTSTKSDVSYFERHFPGQHTWCNYATANVQAHANSCKRHVGALSHEAIKTYGHIVDTLTGIRCTFSIYFILIMGNK